MKFMFYYSCCFNGDAVKKIKNSKIKKLIITDTIDNSQKLKTTIKSRFYLSHL